MEVAEKKCSRCRQVKPASEYAPTRSNSSGLYAYCRPCTRERQREWRMNNPERARANGRAQAARRKAAKPDDVMATDRKSRVKRTAEAREAATRSGRWLAYEDEIAMDPDLSAYEAALMLGRTLGSVEARRDFLRDPERLIATRVRQQAAKEAVALPRAVNRGKEWTGPELELVADESRTAMSVALALGRTVAAVRQQRVLLRKGDPVKVRLAGVPK